MTEIQSYTKSVAAAVGLTIVPIFCGGLIISIIRSLLNGVGIAISFPSLSSVLLSVIFLQGVSFVGFAYGYLWFSKRSLNFISIRIPEKVDIYYIIGGTLALLAVLGAVTLIGSQLDISVAQNTIVQIVEQDPINALYLIPLQFLFVAPGEELLFRGLIQGMLEEVMNPSRAIVIASALFASIHLPSLVGSGQSVYIISAFLLALILGYLYYKTKNIIVPIFGHALFNSLQFLQLYIDKSGII